MSKNNKELFTASLHHFGTLRQMDKLIEEMAELTLAIQKMRYAPTCENRENLHEEFVDVEIVMEQIRINLDKRKLESFMEDRVARLSRLINF